MRASVIEPPIASSMMVN